MEIEVGEFVRTKSGYIAKLIKYLENTETYMFDEYIQEIQNNRYTCISKNELKKEIVKHRKNLIDLIEEGDYVNGCEVITIYGYDEDGNDKDELGIAETDNDIAYYIYLRKINIKTILTHEQFEKNAFRLEE